MLKMTLTLAAAIYAGFVIWGDPSQLGEAEASVSRPDGASQADHATPVILRRALATAPDVTRAVVSAPALVDPARVNPARVAASTPQPAAASPASIGEPIVVSLVRPDAPIDVVAQASAEDADGAQGPLLSVTGSRVNMRMGPSTADPVVGSLPRGTLAEAIGAPQDGWQQIRDVASGQNGWMAARFLDPA